VPRLLRWSRRGGALPGARGVWPEIAESLWPQRPKLAAALDLGGTLPGAYFLRRGLFLPQDLPRLLGREVVEQGLAEYDPLRQTALALADGNGSLDGWLAVQRMETVQYLRNQLLRDADWAAMAHSVELRVPFVDARLSAWLAARAFEPFRSRGKAAVARELLPELPSELFRRKKQGFYVPVAESISANGNAPETQGIGSRALALRVLRDFGVDVRG
jgi:asparagine synthase (glutamine-hydrolysing)